MTYESIFRKAVEWANTHYPTESAQHRAAFANSVSYLVTGISGGCGGPSLREHLVSWSLGVVGTIGIGGQAMTIVTPTMPLPGEWEFNAATKFAAPLCFEPADQFLNVLLQIQEREYCFDDDPIDLTALKNKK